MEQPADTPQRVREAALRLFAARGFEATGIRDVARDAGVSTAALYHYMGGKQDLLLEIIRGGMHELSAGALEAVRGVDDPVEQLERLVRAHVTYHGRKQMVALVSDTELRSLDAPSRSSVVKIRDRYEQLWTDTISTGVERGDFRIDDQKLFRLGLMQMCTGVAYWYSGAGELSLSAIADKFAVLALAMAGSPRAFQDAGRDRTIDETHHGETTA